MLTARSVIARLYEAQEDTALRLGEYLQYLLSLPSVVARGALGTDVEKLFKLLNNTFPKLRLRKQPLQKIEVRNAQTFSNRLRDLVDELVPQLTGRVSEEVGVLGYRIASFLDDTLFAQQSKDAKAKRVISDTEKHLAQVPDLRWYDPEDNSIANLQDCMTPDEWEELENEGLSGLINNDWTLLDRGDSDEFVPALNDLVNAKGYKLVEHQPGSDTVYIQLVKGRSDKVEVKETSHSAIDKMKFVAFADHRDAEELFWGIIKIIRSAGMGVIVAYGVNDVVVKLLSK